MEWPGACFAPLCVGVPLRSPSWISLSSLTKVLDLLRSATFTVWLVLVWKVCHSGQRENSDLGTRCHLLKDTRQFVKLTSTKCAKPDETLYRLDAKEFFMSGRHPELIEAGIANLPEGRSVIVCAEFWNFSLTTSTSNLVLCLRDCGKLRREWNGLGPLR